ncbi:hypothetical protein [Paraburkholderia sp. BR10954]|uniref:hypothetical protein n=1 Tax=Paraburkholderia sp. BR10954 TaxID=3236995 RepID=UPI0034D23413
MVLGNRSRDGERGRTGKSVKFNGIRGHNPTDERGSGKQHCQEQQATPQEHRGKEAILAITQTIPQHANEPEKGNTLRSVPAKSFRAVHTPATPPSAAVKCDPRLPRAKV